LRLKAEGRSKEPEYRGLLQKRPRPTAFDFSLTATLTNPQSPSYPCEHATVAGAASTVLAYLFPDKADEFKARARESTQVWVEAGLHYPSDIKAGLELGQAVGALVVEWAKKDGSDRVGAVDIPPGPCRWTGINPVAPSQEPARPGYSLREASCARARRQIAGLLRGKPNWRRCATIPGPSRLTPLLFTGNRAGRIGTTLLTRRSSSIGWI
jgi:hypothetical protein